MFGDIITDLGAILQGGMGMAGSGNINPNGISMFEPVHGSAPDIAGKGIANPMAQILAGAMMLEELGEGKGAKLVVNAVEKVLEEGRFRTRDIGGASKTKDVGDAVARKIYEIK
jgi:isocitrate/isopropylmalate dehydrogenase